ncbi:SURF1 family protein [Acidovorax sp. 106]|uniref:SURF1 family protein n=1 Tax=Acidovorax sp. 106 TaxID=2135637 RepID=UPI000F2C52BA|nr:SURF1 family protein [Acidovorax sp. 106]RLJ38962.1 surfeit locus 1 family protein [Acidovorax sp. 106]
MTPRPRAHRVLFVLITLAALVGIGVTASLGRWQLGRAAEKLAYQAILEARAAMPGLDGQALRDKLGEGGAMAADAEALLHRAVTLQGRWLPEHTVYLDNRQMQGRPGFYVVTPLLLPDEKTVVLVQRGWVARNFQDRTQVPRIDAPTGPVQVQGRVAALPSRLYEFVAGDSAQGSSRIRQNLDLVAMGAEVQRPILTLSVVQLGDASEGLLRDWPVVSSGVDKHYGYAFQWFGLCGLIALLYVWFQIVRRFFRPRRQRAPSGGG